MLWLWNIGIPPSIYHLLSPIDTEFGDSRLGIPTTNNSHATSIPGFYYAVTGSKAVSAKTGVLLVIQQSFAKAKKNVCVTVWQVWKFGIIHKKTYQCIWGYKKANNWDVVLRTESMRSLWIRPMYSMKKAAYCWTDGHRFLSMGLISKK